MCCAPLVSGCQRSPVGMSLPATNPPPLPASGATAKLPARPEGSPHPTRGSARLPGKPRCRRRARRPRLGERPPRSAPSGGCRWAGGRLRAQRASPFVRLPTGAEETAGAVLPTDGTEEARPRYFSWRWDLRRYGLARAALTPASCLRWRPRLVSSLLLLQLGSDVRGSFSALFCPNCAPSVAAGVTSF